MRHSLQQSVCDVMTEPSAVARRPTPMTVQPSCLAPPEAESGRNEQRPGDEERSDDEGS